MYLPQLLVELGFAATLAKTLLIIENALEAVIEPIFGGLSDRLQWRLGTSLNLISLGVIIASALFIAIPVIVIFGGIPLLLPILAVAWASAMAGLTGTFTGGIGGAVTFAIAAICIIMSQRIKTNPS